MSTSDFGVILIIFVCLVINGIVSAFDTAIGVFGPLRAKHAAEAAGKSGSHFRLWLDHPERVNTTLIGLNTIIIAFCSTVVMDLAIRYGYSSPVVAATGLVTLLVMLFGKVIPKSWARAKAESVAPVALKSVQILHFAFYPVIWTFSTIAERITKSLGGEPKQEIALTEKDLEFLVEAGERDGVIDETKKDIIVSVFDFGETKVREIMTPRTDITALSSDLSLDEVVQIALDTGHSRLPVYDDKIDNVIGILLVKDLVKFAASRKPGASSEWQFRKLLRQAYFVPESKLIMDVFKDLKRTKNHLAVVIDEYGGTAGIVTMEDILEELVGEIQDELDAEEAKIREIEPGIYDVLGATNFDEFLDFFQMEKNILSEDEATDADTVAGFLTQRLGDLPQVGQTVKVGPLNVEVVRVERHRIHTARVSRILAGAEQEDETLVN